MLIHGQHRDRRQTPAERLREDKTNSADREERNGGFPVADKPEVSRKKCF